MSDDRPDMERFAWSKVDPPLPRLPVISQKPRPKSKFSLHLFLLALAIGVAGKLFGPAWARLILEGGGIGNLRGITAFLSSCAVAIILHEAGHFAAACLVGFEILGASIGPVRASHFHGKWTFQFSGKLLTGSISAIPQNNHAWRKRMLLVVAAGPSATFLNGLVSALLLFNFHFGGWTTSYLAFSTELNFFLFVLGLIPNGAKSTVRNDASLCYSLCRNTVEAHEILLYHLVTQVGIAGMRPREYPARLIRKLAAARSRPDMSLAYAQMIVLWAIDCGDLSTADAWDQRAMELCERCDLRLQNATFAKSAFFDVLFRNDMEAAGSKFTFVELDGLSPLYFRHRSKAAYRVAIGDIEESLAEVQRATFSFPARLPYYEFERSLLIGLRRKALEVAETRKDALLAARWQNKSLTYPV